MLGSVFFSTTSYGQYVSTITLSKCDFCLCSIYTHLLNESLASHSLLVIRFQVGVF
jgi:hypothetical protein